MQGMANQAPPIFLDQRARRKAARDAVKAQAQHNAFLDAVPRQVEVPEELPDGRGDVSPALRARVRERLRDRLAFARLNWRKPFRMPTLGYSLKGKTAGTANYRSWVIQLNAVLLRENPEEMVYDTLVHELAHLLTVALHGSEASAHGPEWKAVMRSLGVEPSRTHSMDVSNAVKGEWVFKYRCACGDHILTEAGHRAIVQRRRSATCKLCGRVPRYSSEYRHQGVWYRLLPSGTSVKIAAAPAAMPARAPAVSPAGVPAPAVARPRPETPGGALRQGAQEDTPSKALLGYATDLAAKLGERLPQATLVSRRLLSEFVDEAKRRLAQPKNAPAVSGSSMDDVPTPRQLDFARALAARGGKPLPAEIAASRRALSLWIDQNR